MYERIEDHKRGKARDRNQVANAALRLALFTIVVVSAHSAANIG